MNLIETILYHTDENKKASIEGKYEAILQGFDEISSLKPIIKTEEDYQKCHAIKALLCSLSCFTSNTKHEKDNEVWALESAYGKALHRYNRRLLIKDSKAKTRARYLLWNYRIESVSTLSVLKAVAEDGNLLKQTDDNGQVRLFVYGLHYKVGNNVFSVDSRGREHRQYLETVGRQAFPVNQKHSTKFAIKYRNLLASIPDLNDTHNETWIGNSKGAARNIAFRSEEQLEIANNH